MNHTFIAGHLGADPEVRYTSSGKKITMLRVATRVRRGGKDETIWWGVFILGEQYDKMIPYLKKGSPIMVAGEIDKPKIFTDREGQPQVSLSITATSIHFSPFGRPEKSASSQQEPAASHQEGELDAKYSSNFSTAPVGDVVYGQGKFPSSFADEEVPF